MLTIIADHLPRFMQCNGFRLLQADPATPDGDNTVRDEGNAAHWLAMIVFSGQHTCSELVDRKAPNGIYITADMADHVSQYLAEIIIAHDAVTYAGEMERAYSLTGNGWQINGRGDHLNFTGQTLYINDLKYGYTIVEPEYNWTLISHAVEYCITNQVAPNRIVFTIHQPRADHHAGRVRSWEIDWQQLLDLYSYMAGALSQPSDTLQTGKHCYRCPAFVGCPARQSAEYTGIEIAHDAYRAEISDEGLAARLDQIYRAEELLKQAKSAYEDQAMQRIRGGAVISNYGVENAQTNRVWKDGVTPELIMALTGANITKPATITPKQAEAVMPKEIVNLYSERRSKGWKLKRADANKKATRIFGGK